MEISQSLIRKYPLKLMEDEEVEKIHEGSLKVLKKTGVTVKHKEALDILEGGGCEVDYDNMLVKFPRQVVEQALKSCPKSFIMKARNKKKDLYLDGSNIYFGSHPAPFILDLETGVRRSPRSQDVTDAVTVIDALPNIHIAFVPTLWVVDQPQEIALEWITAEVFRRTEKTTVGCSFGGCAKWIVEMAAVVGENVIGAGACVPPLVVSEEAARSKIIYARAGHPVLCGSGIAMGATGPATIAGTLVQQNAEALAEIVLSQLINPGIGVLYITEAMPMDMRTGLLASGSIEAGILSAATAQIARFYQVPSISFFPMTDAKIPDQQAGYEKALQLFPIAMAGANCIISAGGIDDETCHSLEQLVIDNEMYGMMGRFLEGIRVTDETLAVDLINEVGPIPGSYLGKPHTRKWWKAEQYLPHIGCRQQYTAWKKSGAKDIVTCAKETVKEILKTHQPEPLPKEAEKELKKILEAARNEKRKGG